MTATETTTAWRLKGKGCEFCNIPGVGQAQGTALKNPVTGEEHRVVIDLDQGFIWKRGDCGQGSFEVEAQGVHLGFRDSNWILYDFDWTNQD